jgi:hypothetical protein
MSIKHAFLLDYVVPGIGQTARLVVAPTVDEALQVLSRHLGEAPGASVDVRSVIRLTDEEAYVAQQHGIDWIVEEAKPESPSCS